MPQPLPPAVESPQPAAPPTEPPALLHTLHRHEKASSIAVIIVTLLLIALNIFATITIASYRHDKEQAAAQAALEATPDYQKEQARKLFGEAITPLKADGTLDVSQHFDPRYVIADQHLTIKQGQQANLYNGHSLAILDVKQNWQAPAGVSTLSTRDYTLLTVAVGSRSASRFLLPDTMLKLECTDRHNVTADCGGHLNTSTLEGLPRLGTLPLQYAGQQSKGIIVVATPKDTDITAIHLLQTGTSTNPTARVTMKVTYQL